jgi:hypothetical protein
MLTDKDWQKKKGNVAKLGGETGLGATLEKGKHSYDNVLNAMKVVEGVPNSKFTDEWKHVSAALDATYKELNAISALSGSTENKWKRIPAFPAASLKAVKAIQAAAAEFSKELKAAAHERVSFMAELGIKV